MRRIIFTLIAGVLLTIGVSAQTYKFLCKTQSAANVTTRFFDTYITLDLDNELIKIKGTDIDKSLTYFDSGGVETDAGLFTMFFSNDKDIKSIAMGGGKIGTKDFCFCINYRDGVQIFLGQVTQLQ